MRSPRIRSSRTHQRITERRFPAGGYRASNLWRQAKEVSGVTLVATQQATTTSTMSVPHGPSGVGAARRRLCRDLRDGGAAESVIDDAALVLSELLSNSCRHARALAHQEVHASWEQNDQGEVRISVTDGGGPTLPAPATPSVTARGGRGLAIIRSLARDWGVRAESFPGPVTVWAVLGGEQPA
ncbi:ATP-binding protein [Streptomyces bohaiensis]|uniref:ATP-binding protein n=2 Tax=Streptomyces bohaiensis TaxID=1431344 RepID=A0ABX1CFS1_9ACTN|nr:ATP-binding protein [Streptomyces bohaiensis]